LRDILGGAAKIVAGISINGAPNYETTSLSEIPVQEVEAVYAFRSQGSEVDMYLGDGKLRRSGKTLSIILLHLEQKRFQLVIDVVKIKYRKYSPHSTVRKGIHPHPFATKRAPS
jgi:hypothetical protein